jgi:hypothetical protein
MARGLHHEGFIEDERRVFESRVEIAVRPLLRGFAHRQLAVAFVREIGGGPLQRLNLRPTRLAVRIGRGRRRGIPDVAFQSSVRAAGTKTVDRIDDEGERFEVEIDPFDGLGGRQFIDGGDGENRLALIERLVRQRAFGAGAGGRQIVSGQDGFDAGHGRCGACVDVANPCVRHRAEQQFSEQHPVRAVILGIFRTAGHFGDKIWRRVVLADEFLISHVPLLGSFFAQVSDGCQTPI